MHMHGEVQGADLQKTYAHLVKPDGGGSRDYLSPEMKRPSTDPECKRGRTDHYESAPDMISQITEWRLAYEKLPGNAIEFSTEHFAHAMAVDYVHHSNVGEMVGTQSWQETQDTIGKFCDGGPSGVKLLARSATRCENLELTVNTYEAVTELLHNTHKAMGNTGLLTVQEICDIHRVLLQGLHPDCGKIRTREAYTHWHGGRHTIIHLLTKLRSYFMPSLIITTNIWQNEYTAYIFKCAASLLYEFVSVHPFGDGNG